jgi:ADP-ribose pyrophosphatase YjhB (NUDIX family)
MTLPLRVSARAIIVDPANRVLLMEIEPNFVVDPARPEPCSYWITPGGGVRDGEPPESAVLRELTEETGLKEICVECVLGTVEQELLWKDVRTLVRDHYFLVRTSQSALSIDLMEEEERSIFRGYHWWTASAIVEPAFDLRPHALKELIPQWIGARS